MSTISDDLPDIAWQGEKSSLLHQEEELRESTRLKKRLWLAILCTLILTNIFSIVSTARYIKSKSYSLYSLDLPRSMCFRVVEIHQD